MDSQLSRREFLAGAAALTAALSMGKVSAAGDTMVEIGELKDFPIGTVKQFPSQKVVIVSDESGLYSMSLVCTHKGATIKYEKDKKEFVCPRHGAMFKLDGTVIKKPATSDLPHYALEEKEGKLYALLNKPVSKDTRFFAKKK